MSQLKTGRPSRKEQAIAAVQEVRITEETTRLNINISRAYYKQIKQRALDEDSSITTLVKKALSEYMSKGSSDDRSV